MGSLSIHEIILMLLAAGWRRRYVMAIPLLLLPPLGFLASFMVPKVYETRMTILVQEPGKANPFLNDWAVGPNLKDRIPALKALLHSDHVLENVLIDLGKIKPDTPLEVKRHAVAVLAGNLKSNFIGNDIVDIRLRGRDSKTLAATLSKVGERFTERVLSPERFAIANSEAFLSKQLELKRAALTEAEEKLAVFKTENTDKLPLVLASNAQRLASLKEKLEDKRNELTGAQASFSDLRDRIKSTNPLVGKIEESIIQLTAELSQLKSRYTDEHSEVVSADRRLERLKEEREQIIETSKQLSSDDMDRLWNLAAGQLDKGDKNAGGMPLLVGQMSRFQEAQSKRIVLETDVKQLNDAINFITKQIASFAPIEQTQARLERQVKASSDLYDTLAKRYELAQITGALGLHEAPERAKIIDFPNNPPAKVTLPSLIFIMIGLGAGVVVGIGLAVAYEILDNRLRSTRSFNARFGVMVMTRLPRVRKRFDIDAPPLVPSNRLHWLRHLIPTPQMRDKMFASLIPNEKYVALALEKAKMLKPLQGMITEKISPSFEKKVALLDKINGFRNEARKAARV